MVDLTLPLPGLSPVAGKQIVARFDGGRLSSDGGLLVLHEIERRLEVADRLPPASTIRVIPAAPCIRRRHHPLPDADDRRRLRGRQRRDRPAHRSAVQAGARTRAVGPGPVFAVDHLATGEPAGCADAAAPGPALVDVYCGSFRQVPRRIVLDIDDTFDAVHGGQQLRLFNAHYDDTASNRLSSSMPRVASSPPCCARRSGRRASRSGVSASPGAGDPQPLARGRDPRSCRQPLRLPGRHGLVRDEQPRLRVRPRPQQHGPAAFTSLEESARRASRPIRAKARSAASRNSSTPPGPGAGSAASSPASRPAATAPTAASSSPTSATATAAPCTGSLLPARPGGEPYQGLENPPRRRSHVVPQSHCQPVRLFLHAGAYWLLWSLRALMPKRSSWRVAQFDTLRTPPDQDCRPHRRDENQDQDRSANQRPIRRSGTSPSAVCRG